MSKIARLVPPHADKNWSFQAVGVVEDDVRQIRGAFFTESVKAANPFLQGNSGDWVMVEFWTKDKALIDAAARQLFALVGQELREGDFTREELGLA